MIKGAVVVAINNDHVDYVSMAAWNAERIRRHLDIPVAIITDDPGQHQQQFDEIILCARPDIVNRRNQGFGTASWYNHNRPDVFALSPWDRTLLLDADYVVASSMLRKILDADLDFAAYRWAHDVSAHNDFVNLNFFGYYQMPMWWATVMVFDRGMRCERMFELMKMVRDNWNHYRMLYQIQGSLYRNDHALSIALGIDSGHTLSCANIPWSMATVMPGCLMKQLSADAFRITYFTQQNKSRYIDVQELDLHVMAKQALGDIVDCKT